MGEIHIIEQAVSAMKQQWGENGLNITYDLTPQSNPILKGRVNIIGIDFPCLVENEVNSINIGRIQDLIKGCAELQKIPILLIARYVQPGVYNILRTAGINFVDTVGNYQILYTKGKKLIFQLSHTGEMLGCGAHVVALRRVAVADYPAERMMPLERLQALAEREDFMLLDRLLLPTDSAVAALPKLTLGPEQSEKILFGQRLKLTAPLPNQGQVRLFSAENRFLGVAFVDEHNLLRPQRLIAQS